MFRVCVWFFIRLSWHSTPSFTTHLLVSVSHNNFNLYFFSVLYFSSSLVMPGKFILEFCFIILRRELLKKQQITLFLNFSLNYFGIEVRELLRLSCVASDFDIFTACYTIVGLTRHKRYHLRKASYLCDTLETERKKDFVSFFSIFSLFFLDKRQTFFFSSFHFHKIL